MMANTWFHPDFEKLARQMKDRADTPLPDNYWMLPNPAHALMSEGERVELRAIFDEHPSDFFGWNMLSETEKDDILHGRCLWKMATPKNEFQTILDYGRVLG